MRYTSLPMLGAAVCMMTGAVNPVMASQADAISGADYMTEVQGFFVYPGGNGTAILDSARSNLSGSVVIPDSFTYTTVVNNQTTKTTLKITYINKYAFAGCTNLEQIKLPAGVSRIGDGAFSNCPKLKAVILPDNSKGISLGTGVFEGSDNARIYGDYTDTPVWLGSYGALFAGKLAAEGTWKQSDNGKWWFSYYDGTYPKNEWTKIGGIWYYFDPVGFRETGWNKIDNEWYYLNLDGSMAAATWIGSNYVDQSGRFIPNKWVKTGDRWRYRFGDGTFPKNTWATIDGKRYLFDKEGWMVKGWIELDEGWYHLGNDGALDTNKKVGDCYVNENGLWVQDSWEKTDDGIWRYRYADGTIAKDGLTDIKGKTYYFDKNGRMRTGWIELSDGWRYFRSSGEIARDCHVDGYLINADGIWVQ